MKGLVQVSNMTHPAGWCAAVLSVAAVHVCCSAHTSPVVHYAADAVDIVRPASWS